MITRNEGLQGHFMHISDEFEGGEFHEFLPFSDLNRWVDKDDFLFRASVEFGVWSRLKEIRALSFLSYVGPNPEIQYFIGYDHDRLDHSLVVGMNAGEIGKLNNLPQVSINYLKASGILHDIATPALGDATKSIDPDNLDEEKFWQELLNENGESLLEEERLEKGAIDDIINNRGVLGQVLDIADRITYTMKDLHNVIGGTESKINIHPYLIELRYPLSHHPRIGNIYRDVVVDKKRDLVFFTDVERLGVFLLLRALMHKHLYIEPTSQGRDLFVVNLLRPLYSPDESKPLSPKKLRKLNDREALDILAKHYEFPRLQGEWLYTQLTNWNPSYEKCDDPQQADQKAKEISNNGLLVLGIKECKGFDAGLSYLTLDENQKVGTFENVDPVMAQQIRGIENDTRAVYVFYTDVSEDTPINELLRKVHGMPHSIATEDEIG